MRRILFGIGILLLGCNQVSGVNDFTFRDDEKGKAKANSADSDSQGTDDTGGTDGTDSVNSGLDGIPYAGESTDPTNAGTSPDANTGDGLGNIDAVETTQGTTDNPAVSNTADTDNMGSITNAEDTSGTAIDPNAEADSINGSTVDDSDGANALSDETGVDGDNHPDSQGENEGEVVDDSVALDDLSCPVDDTMLCDYYICPIKDSRDSTKAACDGLVGAGEAAEASCAGQLDCYRQYLACFVEKCPPGSSDLEQITEASSACSTLFTACANSLGGS